MIKTKSQQQKLRPKLLVLALLLFTFLSGNSLYGQKTVTGRIIDDAGLTVLGVNILEKGTSNGAISDLDGNFTITVASNESVLKFSFIGFETKLVTVGDRTILPVTLNSDAEALDELVVTAMGINREAKSLGYAMQTVKSEDLTLGGDLSPVGALSGKIAGVQITSASAGVDGTPRVVIRGVNSMSNDNQPLFVIDGIPVSVNQNSDVNSSDLSSIGSVSDFGSPLSDISPSDIESVNVLKGASATALYGSRASNGVILITTKRADKNDKGIGISINSTTTFQNPLYLPEYQSEYGWGKYGQSDFIYDPIKQFDGNSWGARLDEGTKYVQYNSPIDPETGERIASPWTSHENNYQNFFQTGIVANNNIAISSVTEKASTRFSYTNVYQKDMIPTVAMKKNSFNFNTSINLNEKLSVDVVSNYTKTSSPNRTSGSGEGIMASLLYMSADVDVRDLDNHLTPSGNMRSYQPKEINPYYVIRENTYSVQRERFSGKINMNYEFYDWVKLRVGVSRDQTLNLNQRMTNINRSPDDFWGNTEGEFSDSHNFIAETNMDFLLQIDRKMKFNDNFRYSFNVGGNMMQINQRNTSAYTNGGLIAYGEYNLNNSRLDPKGDTYTSQKNMNSIFGQAIFSYGDFAFVELTGRNDWTSTLPAEARSYFYPSITGSFIFTDAFEINPRIISFGKIRANWARVGSDTDPYNLVRYAEKSSVWTGSILPYSYRNEIPPVGLKPEFNTTKEVGLVMNFFNNRLSFDVAAYEAIIENQILSVPTAPSRGFENALVNIGKMQNKGVELMIDATAVQTDDFSWGITANWSTNKTALLKYVNRMPYRKIGDLAGATIYAPNISYYDQLRSDINNGAADKGKLNYMDDYLMNNGKYGDIFGSYYIRDNEGNLLTDGGRPVHSGMANNYIDTDGNVKAGYSEAFGNAIRKNMDGNTIIKEQYLRANTQPKFIASIRNKFTYKQFAMSFLFDCNWGGTFVSSHYLQRIKNGVSTLTVGVNDKGNPIRNRVIINEDGTYSPETGGVLVKGNDITTGETNGTYVDAEQYFKIGENSNFAAEAGLISGTYVKLREFTLTYNLPSSFVSKMSIQRASISFVGNNLLLIHGFDKVPDFLGITTDENIKAPFDPESSMGAGNGGVGLEYGSLPSPRSIGFNIAISF